MPLFPTPSLVENPGWEERGGDVSQRPASPPAPSAWTGFSGRVGLRGGPGCGRGGSRRLPYRSGLRGRAVPTGNGCAFAPCLVSQSSAEPWRTSHSAPRRPGLLGAGASLPGIQAPPAAFPTLRTAGDALPLLRLNPSRRVTHPFAGLGQTGLDDVDFPALQLLNVISFT